MEAMHDDSGVRLEKLRADGGMASNRLFLQILTNIVGVDVVVPNLLETTALGVAMAAGKAKGIDLFQLQQENETDLSLTTYTPQLSEPGRILFFPRLTSIA